MDVSDCSGISPPKKCKYSNRHQHDDFFLLGELGNQSNSHTSECRQTFELHTKTSQNNHAVKKHFVEASANFCRQDVAIPSVEASEVANDIACGVNTYSNGVSVTDESSAVVDTVDSYVENIRSCSDPAMYTQYVQSSDTSDNMNVNSNGDNMCSEVKTSAIVNNDITGDAVALLDCDFKSYVTDDSIRYDHVKVEGEAGVPKGQPSDLNLAKRDDLCSVSTSNNLSDHSQKGVDNYDAYSNSGRPLRKCRQVTREHQDFTCPCCKGSFRYSDLEAHLEHEMNLLRKRNTPGKGKTRCSSQRTSANNFTPSCSTGEVSNPGNRQDCLRAVQQNRKKRERKVGNTGTECPVCARIIHGTQEELNSHVNDCLSQESLQLDVETFDSDDESFEEYEWAGQTRVRVTTFLTSVSDLGYSAKSSRPTEVDDDTELNIDGDDSDMYGQEQFSEADLIPCTGGSVKEVRESQALREAVLNGGESSSGSNSVPSTTSSHDTKLKVSSPLKSTSHSSSVTAQIESLKARIREIERGSGKSTQFKCLICMDPYDLPVVSVQCWHVYCERCWLQSLGAKKLCPQCNAITHPASLRRIYF